MTQQPTVCISCGGGNWLPIESANAGSYLRCRNCSYHVQAANRTDKYRRFEEEQKKNYGENSFCNTPLFDYLSYERQERRISILAKICSSGKVIEVGPGSGQMLERVRGAGYEVQAAEHSEDLANRISHNLDVEVLCGEFEKLDIEAASFDVFMSFHVIEHVADVDAHLRQAAKIVKTGGYALIATPCTDSWEHRAPFGLSPNYSTAHLQLFSKESMSRLLEKNGWTVEKILTPSYAEYYVRVLTATFRLLKRKVSGKVVAGGAYSQSSEKNTGKMLKILKMITVLTFPLRRFQESIGSGNEILVVARRVAR